MGRTRFFNDQKIPHKAVLDVCGRNRFLGHIKRPPNTGWRRKLKAEPKPPKKKDRSRSPTVGQKIGHLFDFWGPQKPAKSGKPTHCWPKNPAPKRDVSHKRGISTKRGFTPVIFKGHGRGKGIASGGPFFPQVTLRGTGGTVPLPRKEREFQPGQNAHGQSMGQTRY